ncbi:hypothetical protein QAD02_001453 [Eretmocerus hayati]|uniref:Uncharacterized protein n=1 Tax=Eretmocerus hayati TaxID=131215 RepID=A0ACC2NG27_9HYME|nr:hypothetical protein QAD02_001453 [Eretmocerus hayati]
MIVSAKIIEKNIQTTLPISVRSAEELKNRIQLSDLRDAKPLAERSRYDYDERNVATRGRVGRLSSETAYSLITNVQSRDRLSRVPSNSINLKNTDKLTEMCIGEMTNLYEHIKAYAQSMGKHVSKYVEQKTINV